MNSQLRRFALGIFLPVMTACSDSTLPRSQGVAMSDARESSATTDRGSIAQLSEQELIERILDNVPASIRTLARADLLDTTKVMQSEHSTIGPLMARLAELRDAKHVDARVRAEARQASDAKRRASLVRVTVALSPDLGDESIRAVVLRRPNDGGMPLLMLREADATSKDLQMGLAAAAKAAADYGVSTPKLHRRLIRSHGGASANDKNLEPHLALLRKSNPTSISGIGALRAIDVLTDRFGPEPKK